MQTCAEVWTLKLPKTFASHFCNTNPFVSHRWRKVRRNARCRSLMSDKRTCRSHLAKGERQMTLYCIRERQTDPVDKHTE